jgi:hypothetical protein
MRKSVALPILSSDALSSVAYGPEAMLAVLALAGSAALGVSLRLSAAIVVLMIAVGLLGLPYRQVIKAYPRGGGSYVVAGAIFSGACIHPGVVGTVTPSACHVAEPRRGRRRRCAPHRGRRTPT